MKKALTLTIISIISVSLFAQNRVEKPIQIHTNWSGLFLKTIGKTFAGTEVQSLEVDNWQFPGINVGYHVNERLYVGYSFQPNRTMTLIKEWTFSNLETNDALTTLEYKTGIFHDYNFRYTPFKFKVYFSGNIFHTSKGSYQMNAMPISQNVQIGEGSKLSQIVTNWNFKSFTTVGLGLGYNYVHKSGISFDVGIGIPIPLFDNLYENIQFNWLENIAVPENDLNFAKEKIENELFYYPVRFNLNVGYNFSIYNNDK